MIGPPGQRGPPGYGRDGQRGEAGLPGLLSVSESAPRKPLRK